MFLDDYQNKSVCVWQLESYMSFKIRATRSEKS